MRLFSSSPTKYAYINARVSAMKSRLLPKETYAKLMNMSITEIARFIGETEYKSEIDELAGKYSGIDLVEFALSLNLARTYRKLIEVSQGEANALIKAYLRRWDIYNIKTLIRGKLYNVSEEEIIEEFVSAGNLSNEFLLRLAKSSIDEIISSLERTPYFDLIKECKEKQCQILEEELDKFYYENLLKSLKAEKGNSVRLLEKFIKMEIDIENISSLLRLKKDGIEGKDIFEHLLDGGEELNREKLNQLSSLSYKELLKALEQFSYFKVLAELNLEKASIGEIENKLYKYSKEHSLRISRYYPLTILPILGYIQAKKIEVDNIRAIVRGKERNLKEETIKSLLVV